MARENPLTPFAARSLNDLAICEDATRPDFEVASRFLDTSKELSRLALLGIAGYGFMFKEMIPKVENTLSNYQFFAMFAGLIALGVSAGAGLYSTHLSTRCLAYQVDILRYLKRQGNAGWSAEEQAVNKLVLESRRHAQGVVVKKGKKFLVTAVAALILGMTFTVVAMIFVLWHRSFLPGTHASAP